jgi:hypothetical protein
MAITATKALSEVRSECICNDQPQSVGTVSLGDVIRQGDVMLVAIGSLPNGKPTSNRQLAPGTSQGSRHILEGECELFTAAPEAVAAAIARANGASVPVALLGPVFRTGEKCELTHPEHGNFLLPAGECFATVYQRDFAEEVRRVAD